VAGGIDVNPVLGSRSTLVVAGLGGCAGRPLRVGDRLAATDDGGNETRVAERGPRACARGLDVVDGPRRAATRVLRIIPGEHADAFGGEAWARGFCASSRSDRMGVRLEGEPLPGAGAFAGMASVAVFPGTVQVPPDGQPIVLLADAQTIGGYPVLGQVIAADLPQAAQLRPGDELRFEPVSLAEARIALREQEMAISAMYEAMR
jgi:antagonist of KipI